MPQIVSLEYQKDFYSPVFWHSAIDQDRPVGSRATFDEHIHDFYHIVLYTHGQGWYSQEGRYLPAAAGTCVLIHPGQRHDFISKRETAVYSELTFSYENLHGDPLKISFQEILRRYAGIDISLEGDALLSAGDCQMLKNLLFQITDYLNSGRESSVYHAHRILAHIFDFLIEHYAKHQPSEMIDDRFFRVRMWIEEHYLETLEIDDLAKMANVSRGYFFRAFKNAFGVAPLAYQQQLRVEAAKTLLKATTLRCNEIAQRVGFKDVYFFHRTFKKHTGLTPNQYRRR